MHSISTWAPSGSAATPIVLRAGRCVKCFPYSSLTSAKVFMSVTKMVVYHRTKEYRVSANVLLGSLFSYYEGTMPFLTTAFVVLSGGVYVCVIIYLSLPL